MELQQQNFGLNGFINYTGSDDEYDHLLKRFREKRAEKKEDRKQRKDDKRAERQEKRELNTEKKRLKNELKQTQIDERKTQLGLLAQAPGIPSGLPAAASSDNSMMIVAAVVGVVFIAGIGYVLMNKKKMPLAPVAQAA